MAKTTLLAHLLNVNDDEAALISSLFIKGYTITVDSKFDFISLQKSKGKNYEKTRA